MTTDTRGLAAAPPTGPGRRTRRRPGTAADGPATSTPATRTALRVARCPSPCGRLLPGLVILVAVVQMARPVGDPDTFWHLAAGDRLRETWSFNGPDPWSTMSTQPWRLHEWLPELLMSFAQQVLGLPGVSWLLPLGGAAIAPAPVGASCAGRPRSSPPTLVLVVALVGDEPEPVAAAAPASRSPSPWPVTGAWLRTRRGRPPPVVARPGDVGLGLQPRHVVRRRRHRGRRARRDRRSTAPCAAARGCASRSCPLGLARRRRRDPDRPRAAPVTLRRHASTTQFVDEWSSPSLTDVAFVAFLVARRDGRPRLGARAPPHPRGPRSSSSGSPIGFALLYVRTVAVGAAIIAPMAATAIQGLLPAWTREPLAPPRGRPDASASRRRRCSSQPCPRRPTRRVAGVGRQRPRPPARGPAAAAPSLCNDYGVGGWLIWKHPNVRPTIDGRVEIYAVRPRQGAHRLRARGPGLAGLPARGPAARYALLTKDQPVVEALVRQAHWTVVQRGSTYVLLRAPR